MAEPHGLIDRSDTCNICGAATSVFGETVVLQKYLVKYLQCGTCGFIQTERPHWLGEAYSSAITRQDVGIMQRNLANAEISSAVIRCLYPGIRSAIDFGGGHGIFVRLMRDRGFPFDWYDSHAPNDYARGFEFVPDKKYDFLTAFEVLEHLADPMTELSKMMGLAPHLFVSTVLIPRPTPKLCDWWYYSPMTGQHISFYSRNSLEFIARRFQRTLLSNGPFHVFTNDIKSPLLFRIATRQKLAWLLNCFQRRSSLTQSDHRQVTK